ncbi:MAG TPA: hypothetical protein VIZ69_00730, partial [Thermoanaerobaculia bacterium]
MTLESRPSNRTEIEVKLPCHDLALLREKLAGLSAVRTAEEHLEVNDLYDDIDGRLSKRGCALRLRR